MPLLCLSRWGRLYRTNYSHLPTLLVSIRRFHRRFLSLRFAALFTQLPFLDLRLEVFNIFLAAKQTSLFTSLDTRMDYLVYKNIEERFKYKL